MSEEEIADVLLRPKRQITLPLKVCEKLGLEYGDKLELKIKDNTIIAKPKKTIALEALNEIRNAFKKSGITEKELLRSVEEIRHGKA
jgi:AbrB family looped-hinge helix DNA binding protein